MREEFARTLPIAEAIQRLLYPYVEVVIHDIKKNQIVAIYNAFSTRKVGDPSLLTKEKEIATLEDCEGPYEKINWDGRTLKSTSSLITDDDGNRIGLLCINFDLSVFQTFQGIISNFLDCHQFVPQPAPLFKDDWQERINQYLYHYLKERNITIDAMSRQEKKALIEHLYKIGAFTGKNSATYIAQVMQVSRATVYNYLAIVQEQEQETC